jgi:hypothetical protein
MRASCPLLALTSSVLDLICLDTHDVTSSVVLEQPEPKLGEAGSSKSALRIAPFWAWRDLHLAQSGSRSPAW